MLLLLRELELKFYLFLAIHVAQEVWDEGNIIGLMTRTDHWAWNLFGGTNEAVMYESVKQGKVELNIVFEPGLALRNP